MALAPGDEAEVEPRLVALSIDRQRSNVRIGWFGSEAAVNRLEQARSTPSGFGKGGRFGIRTTEHASCRVGFAERWDRLGS